MSRNDLEPASGLSQKLESNPSVTEQRQPDRGKWHTLIGSSDQELACKEAQLRASGEWHEGDHIIAIHLVAAENGRPALTTP
jgi:hypothetical protein